MDILIWVLIIAVVVAIALALWRFLMFRSRGTSVIMRRLPAVGAHGWRHGSVRYNGEELEFFQLRSLSPVADLVLNRQSLDFHENRQISEPESAFMTSRLTVTTLCQDGHHYEMALDPRGLMALTAWVESAPSARQERTDFNRLRNRITRGHNGK
ncbi:DUF2550 domain-containing protein [Corynebacterium alimapuense]|uniref:DUF2550 domain-containing protein n=1 Tax=Corynebacterium alimapuense TaxID=1576874 RepID=A0A3M8K5B0_9CORY|nr:DUF2550 domain-containing protein [Corynebacterium alimapuense]RNE48391.1 DUF2550 domain-containing protein [Corynebacterium alimapuense]